MKMFLAPVIALLALVPSAVPAAPAGQPHSVHLAAPAPTAAGREAVFTVTANGDSPSALTLDYHADGGEVTGVLSLNESAPGTAQASVYVQRMTPGEATLIASLGGSEVSRATVTFLPSARLSISLALEAEAGAAARTFAFEVLSAAGTLADVVHVGTSGDAPFATSDSAPLLPGDYVLRPVLGRDVAAECGGSAFYAIQPATAQALILPTNATPGFTVRLCPALPRGYGIDMPYDPQAPSGITNGELLPPATGNGQVERPVLSDRQARQLFGLVITVVVAMVIGTFTVRLLAHVAPVRKQGKRD